MKDSYFLKQNSNVVCSVTLLGPPENGVGLITYVWTHPKFRRNGLASSLFHCILLEADAEVVQLWLKIEPDDPTDFNHLDAWYAKLGFIEIEPDDPTRVRNPILS